MTLSFLTDFFTHVHDELSKMKARTLELNKEEQNWFRRRCR